MRVVGALELGSMIAGASSELAGAAVAWHAEVSAANWSCDADVAARHVNAAFDGDRILFDLGQDGHCVIVRVNYGVGSVCMKYIGERTGAPWGRRRMRGKAKVP